MHPPPRSTWDNKLREWTTFINVLQAGEVETLDLQLTMQAKCEASKVWRLGHTRGVRHIGPRLADSTWLQAMPGLRQWQVISINPARSQDSQTVGPPDATEPLKWPLQSRHGTTLSSLMLLGFWREEEGYPCPCWPQGAQWKGLFLPSNPHYHP